MLFSVYAFATVIGSLAARQQMIGNRWVGASRGIPEILSLLHLQSGSIFCERGCERHFVKILNTAIAR
jgi:hypothetical protein